MQRYFAAIVFSLWVLTGSAQAQNRIALVIGNGTYKKVAELTNPTNDAADVSASLERLGFTVSRLTNGTYDEMRRALLTFSAASRSAEMAVVFFAGHGMEIAGENWLIPVDAELASDVDIEQEAIGLRAVMLMVSSASKLGLVILDACRNNPFAAKMARSVRSRSVERGLARVEPAGSVLVAFAAKDGTTAADGSGRNSPFTSSLLRNLEIPGLEINFLFRNVRDDVIMSTKREQEPFVYGSLSREAIFLKAPALDGLAASVAEDAAWSYVRNSNDPAQFRRFLFDFPQTQRRTEVERLIDALERVPAASRLPPSKPQSKVCFMFNGQQVCH